jgi:hypothetical protein
VPSSSPPPLLRARSPVPTTLHTTALGFTPIHRHQPTALSTATTPPIAAAQTRPPTPTLTNPTDRPTDPEQCTTPPPNDGCTLSTQPRSRLRPHCHVPTRPSPRVQSRPSHAHRAAWQKSSSSEQESGEHGSSSSRNGRRGQHKYGGQGGAGWGQCGMGAVLTSWAHAAHSS